jgi:hypothetical protein
MTTPKLALCALALGCILFCGLAQQREAKRIDEWEALDISLKSAKSIHPKNGFVPDESTAVRIGEAVAIAQYGEKAIAAERPFRARLKEDVWIVKGTLHPQGAFGGTAVIKIGKADGRVLFLTHQE